MNGVYIKKLNKISFNVVKIEQIPTIWIKVEKKYFQIWSKWILHFCICGVEGDINVEAE